MSIERPKSYQEALSNVRSTIQRKLSVVGVSEDGRLELSNFLVMVDDMLRPNRTFPEARSDAPEPLSGSF
ncbi:hypothetical protein FPV16_21770 [Methylobacterium sp. W2]|uniref:hypothetical protein n=1 Tax=Methylobacterium sp. W2 TaxID=2598107 RepID=UPI001D0C7FBB|nr:hypothetical protein [Methylobacterium sp. W2]MCC0808801.1 hypothetical protein [Methylobacterium sp. W2]